MFDAPNLAALLEFHSMGHEGTEFADRIIRRYIAADDVSRVSRSVSVVQSILWQDNPHDLIPKACGTPLKQNVNAPKTRFFDEWRPVARYVQKCDLYVFRNSVTGRELQLFVSTALKMPKSTKNYFQGIVVITLVTG